VSETSGFPAIKRGSDDFDVCGVAIDTAPELKREFIAVVEATIPC
jgi:hypothetical protein